MKQAFHLDTRLCQVFGFSVAVTFNYAINRRFSFEHARRTPLVASYVAYLGTNLIGLTLRMLAIHVLMALTDLDQGRGYLLLSVIGISLATLVNFVGAKYFAFAPKRMVKTEVVDSFAPPAVVGPSAASAWSAIALGAGLIWTAGISGNPPRPLSTKASIASGGEHSRRVRGPRASGGDSRRARELAA